MKLRRTRIGSMGMFAALSFVCAALVPATASAAGGPQCDFASRFAQGESTFDYYEVTACFDSVPLNPADVQNTADVALYWMEQSTPAVSYDAQVNWRRAINKLKRRRYRSDFEFQDAAFQAIQNTLKNAHYNYIYPECYWAFRAIQPFALGSTIVRGRNGKKEQIIFIEGTVQRDAYLAETGIDADGFIGKKIVSINGVPALRFLKRWARQRGRWDRDAGNELDRILMSNTYSVRAGVTDLVFPERASNSYVLEDVYGNRSRLSLPWVFQVQSPSRLRDSAEELAEFCSTPNPLVPVMNEAMAAGPDDEVSPEAQSLLDRASQAFVMGMDMDAAKDEARGRKTRYRRLGGFVEIPDDQRGILLDDFDPPLQIRGWRALKYDGGRATVIQIANQTDLAPDTIQLLQTATDFACGNSEEVIIDLRGNPGGILLEADWLTHYFYPDQNKRPDNLQSFGPGTTAYQMRQIQYWTDFTVGGGAWAQALGLPLDGCNLGFEPGCFASVSNGALLNSLAWYTDTTFESLGGKQTPLNPPFHFAQFIAPLQGIQCPGKFERDRLIVLTDGRTCSTSFQLANQLAPRATVVSIGGVLGEDKAIGVCRGGNVTDTDTLTFLQNLITTELDNLGVDGSQLVPPVSTGPNVPLFNRAVNMRVELWSVRSADLATVVPEEPPLGPRPDLIVRTWQDVFDEDTNGFVYRKVLRAVERRR